MSAPPSAAPPHKLSSPHETLGLKEAIAIIVGIVIGAGIFKAPSLVATFTGSEGWMFAAWAAGGLISLIGALCYAELATAYPNAGGDYHFLHRAYGRGVSFLFGWARVSVITTGSIALLGFVFGDYTSQVVPLGTGHDSAVYAALAILVLTSINATMIVGARTNYSLGRDWPVLGRLGEWDERREAPIFAMYVQSAAALVLVLIGATATLGGGFKAMVEFTAPVFWLFFLLSGISLFVLRQREPDTERPFKVPLYPLTPLIFCAVCAYMLWSSLNYVYSKELGGLNAAWIGVLVLAVGGVIFMLLPRRAEATSPAGGG